MTDPQPPVAKKIHEETQIHGTVLVDDYLWLREKENPEVTAYLEAENAYAEVRMKHTEGLQKKLYAEMVSHIKETDVNVPWKKGGYFYLSRWEKGKQYPIRARKKGSLDAPEEITLDVNKLAEGQEFMAVGAYEISGDSNLLAYSTDNSGFRQYRLHVRDLATGKDLPDTAEKTGAVVWAADSKTLFYTIEDNAKRHFRLYRHRLGEDVSQDKLVYEETDERFRVGVGASRSGKYLFLTIGSATTSEVRYIESDKPDSDWQVIAPREQDIEYYAANIGDRFFIRTNDKGRNFRLVSAPASAPGRSNWREEVAHREDVMLEEFDPFESFYVLYELENGLPELRVVDLASGKGLRISFPEPVYFARPQTNREYTTGKYRYAYQSLVTPSSVFDYDIASGTSQLLKQDEIPGGYDPSLYASERVWAPAPDGVKVPVAVIYRKDLKKPDGSNPLYIDGYGSYGILSPATFESNRLSMLDRGVVMAYAQIRGGGDLGKPWHDDGRMMNKMNTFTDFIACAEYLSANGYGARDNIAIEGGSAPAAC